MVGNSHAHIVATCKQMARLEVRMMAIREGVSHKKVSNFQVLFIIRNNR
jgi:hypothetical protein